MQLRRESELARLRSDFIASVSHELRTPLAQVRMFAETLLLGRVRSEEERLRSLQIVDQEARRLTHLVENILQFSRAERQAIRLAPVPSELASQVTEAVEAFAPVARSRHVVVQTALENDVVCVVDPAALRQILLNLLDNAVKYGPIRPDGDDHAAAHGRSARGSWWTTKARVSRREQRNRVLGAVPAARERGDRRGSRQRHRACGGRAARGAARRPRVGRMRRRVTGLGSSSSLRRRIGIRDSGTVRQRRVQRAPVSVGRAE